MADETKPKKAPKKEAAEGAAAPAAEAKPAAETKEAKAPRAKKAAAPGEGAEGKPAAAPGAADAVPAAGVAPTAAELLGEDANAKKIVKAKGSKNISTGIANILATFNNTQVNITDMHGNILGWSSARRDRKRSRMNFSSHVISFSV